MGVALRPTLPERRFLYSNPMKAYEAYLPPPLRELPWRAHPLDGKLLLFERNSGLNALLEGEETAYLERIAPRTLLIAVTNACNLSCPFCYRNLKARSTWTYESLFAFCREADQWGVLEVAFGGGEPMLFPRWRDFVRELYETTRLCVNFTTNGTLLTTDFLHGIAGCYGQIRLSLYDTYEDNDWPQSVARLVDAGARFGVNWLIIPAELVRIEEKFARLWGMGVRDFLLISYKGPDPRLHVSSQDYSRLADFVNQVYSQSGGSISIKLDVCWGDHLPQVPRLFAEDDCLAGDEFLSITSDKRLKPCSFHHEGIAVDSLEDVRSYWERARKARKAARIGGCARLLNRGLSEEGVPDGAIIPLAAMEQ